MSKIPTKHSALPPTKVVFRAPRAPTVPQQRHSFGRTVSNNRLKIGDRVLANGKSGTIAFIGRTKFAEGEWMGINLDEPQGKNDGSHGGVRYFETDPNRGLFCRPDKVQRLALNGAAQRHTLYNPSRLSIIASENNNASGITTTDTVDPSSTKNLQIGDRVVVRGTKFGTLKYVGKIHIDEGIWCGIKLDGPLGRHDGKIKDIRYFTCPHRFGLFAPLRRVEKVIGDSEDLHALNRQSIISTDSYNQLHDSESQESNLSEFSTSTNSLNNIPTRSPVKTRKPILSKDLTLMETSLSSQIAKLVETIKEKDIFIEKLQQLNDKVRLEFSHATEKVTKMENHIVELQRQYKIKENENQDLIREQLDLKQHLEDLQYQLSELDEDSLTTHDDHHLLSPDEFTNYEKIKEKNDELELINKKLIHDNQIFQEEVKRHNESKEKDMQIESLQLEITHLRNKEQSQTTEKETFHKQQIKEYQSKIDQITKADQNVRLRLTSLEQEKQSNEKRINDLLDELEQHNDSIIPDLQRECQMLKSELENRVHTANMAMNERETYYEEQIKEYQSNINEAIRETEKVRLELKQIHEENNLKEQKTNLLINELKQNYEKIQTELNDRERQVDLTLNQHESHYEKQIKEYENNLNQATRDTENIQVELAKLEEEKTSHDQKSNTIINSLKHDYERQCEMLKTQLIELQDQDRAQTKVLNERIAYYEIEVKEYQAKIDQDVYELQNLRSEVKKLQEEKTLHEKQLNEVIETMKEDHQKQYQELQTELDELNEREHKARKALHQHESQFDQRIEEYHQKLEQANLKTEHLQSELEKLQAEKTNFNDTINLLTQDLETLKTEIQDRDCTQNTAFDEREAHYKSQIKEHQIKSEQFLLEIQHLQSKLTNLKEEKSTMENEFKNNIDTLQQDYEKLQNKQEHDANNTLHQRDLQFEEQVKEYQEKLEQTNLQTEHLQSELEKLREEKTNLNDTIDSLTRDVEILKTEIQDRDRTQNTALNECETHYKSQIKELQVKTDQSLLEIQDLQSKLTNLQEEKSTIENELNETIRTLQQDYEKLQNEQRETILKECHAQYEQEIDEYQRNLELSMRQTENIQSDLMNLQEEKESNKKTLSDIMNSLKEDFENQIEILKTENIELQERYDNKEQELKKYQSKFDQTDELIQHIEHLTLINETFQKELEHLKYQTEPTETDQLTQQLNDLQQLHTDVLDQLANREQQYIEEKKAQEKIFQAKIDEYEMKEALMKSEFMVDMENNKLDHDQEILRLKGQIQQLTAGKGKK